MINRIIITIALICITRIAPAATIDLPGYDFAEIARSASFEPSAAGAYTHNYLSPSVAITDSLATTYIFANEDNARVDLEFGTDVYSGSGFDISLFFVGGGAQGHVFGLSLPDNLSAFPDAVYFDSNDYAHYTHTGFNLYDGDDDPSNDYSIFRMDIDLDEYGFLGENPIGALSLAIGNKSAVPSLVGAYHREPAAVVPIPLPIVLFSSGLALLGFVARRT